MSVEKVNVEDIMAGIRADVEAKKSMGNSPQEPISHVSIHRLLEHYDRSFVVNAYNILFGRSPTDDELWGTLKEIQSTSVDRLGLIKRWVESSEVRKRGVVVDGLTQRLFMRRVSKVPILGYVFELILDLALLPLRFRHFMRFEDYIASENRKAVDLFSNMSVYLESKFKETNRSIDDKPNRYVLQELNEK
ncbi:MAG: hypothetical protein KKD39_05495, partial [Candidatus Altiarchaeota archaeon]|nr:hypothetical protein [Candidatus Altiarchaeota archaeon]